MSPQEVNQSLQIVNLKGKIFKCSKGGVWEMKNCCGLYHPSLGYFAFEGETPYTPSGGRKSLEAIMKAGGFTDFDNAIWLKECGVN
jgi:hypothetical protein